MVEAGEGERHLLLVHGFTGAGNDFADHVDALADAGWHVVAPDLRGHGTSDAPSGESAYSLALLAGDVLALVDALGWDRFALLGHSMGGMIAQLVALAEPSRLVALVLMDTAPGPIRLDADLIALGVAMVRAEGTAGLADFFAGQPGGGPLETPAAERVRAERPERAVVSGANLRSASADMYAAMATEMLVAEDRRPALASLTVPTLVVVGEQDTPFLRASTALADAIPGARLEVVPDAGHSPQLENPEAWAKALTTFLSAVDGRPPESERSWTT